MAKPLPTYLIDPAQSAYIGFVWPVVGSRGDNYNVELTPYGWNCTCQGFRSHRKCKHAVATDQLLGGDNEFPKYQIPLG